MNEPPVCAPVVFLVFNRPALTAKVLAAIRQARPRSLLIVADGPRTGRDSDVAACAQVRELIAKGIDWPAEVRTRYAPSNLGLRQCVASGLDWAFQQVEQAIVLEDDCVPHLSFFRFCSELLRRYEQDSRIGVITGDNFQPQPFVCSASYYFSRFNHCWGWATWRRAWRFYDLGMAHWPALRDGGWLQGLFPDSGALRYWTEILEKAHHGRIDTWDYAWTFACWSQQFLTATPSVNLVANVGFGAGATHTTHITHPLANLPTAEMRFPLRHPPCVTPDYPADDHVQRIVFGSARPRRLKSFLGRWRRLLSKPSAVR